MTAALLDCSVRLNSIGDFRYSATFRVGDCEVRVRLCRDGDREVAFAVAETLFDLRWWTLLKAEPPIAADRNSDVLGLFERFARDLAVFALVVRSGGAA